MQGFLIYTSTANVIKYFDEDILYFCIYLLSFMRDWRNFKGLTDCMYDKPSFLFTKKKIFPTPENFDDTCYCNTCV